MCIYNVVIKFFYEMVIELLIFILFVWIIFALLIKDTHTQDTMIENHYDSMIDEVCNKSKFTTPRYLIKESNFNNGTYTEFKANSIPVIHLCLIDRGGFKYDDNTIKMVVLHEIAHVLCTDEKHTELYNRIEESLIVSATELGWVNPNNMNDQYYPCKYE